MAAEHLELELAQLRRTYEEALKLNAETAKLRAEADKLHAEGLKLKAERWYMPLVVSTTAAAAIVGAFALMLRLLS